MLDLSAVEAAEMLVARLELRSDEVPVLCRFEEETDDYVDLLALEPETYPWDLKEAATLSVRDPFLRLRILDLREPALAAALAVAEYVRYDGHYWKLSREQEPLGDTRIYTCKLTKTRQTAPVKSRAGAAMDLTPVTAAELLVNRLELDETLEAPVLESYDEELDRYTDLLACAEYDWDFREVTNYHVGKSFARLRLLEPDDGDASGAFRAALFRAETARYEGWRWQVSREQEPFGGVRLWVLKLERLAPLP